MAELVADCPRCGAREMTFDFIYQLPIRIVADWQRWFEAFCICRSCRKSTTFVLRQKNIADADKMKDLVNAKSRLNEMVNVEGYISIKDEAAQNPPEHLPSPIEEVFKEGSACMSIGCYNAAGTMFRLCLDLATKDLLPEDTEEGPNARTRRDLGLRLPWLFDDGKLPEALRRLSSCIREDANDAAHKGTLGEKDASDIQDFTYTFLERIYTEPEKIRLAEERTKERRKGAE